MRKVFADTGYWIALLNPNDELNLKARSVTASLSANARIVTSEMVFTELLNAFSKQGSILKKAAISLINKSWFLRLFYGELILKCQFNKLRKRKLLKLRKPYPRRLISLSLLLIPSTVPLVVLPSK